MKLILSRKGVDSASGGCASPIIDGKPVSLPIPTKREGTRTTYHSLGLGQHFEKATRGKRSGAETCHEDPMFADGVCGFGQTGSAQSHLANQGVGPGDVFLFFGVFSNPDGSDRHHRIFGYLKIEEVIRLGANPNPDQSPASLHRLHPHVIDTWNKNNTLYYEPGRTARSASDHLRLSVLGASASVWSVPPWLKAAGLTYHTSPKRWLEGDRLASTGRGQEFIAPVSTVEAQTWLASIIQEIER